MHHYPHHVGDFDKNTRHLSRLERCIYRDMLDLYYTKERALLADEGALFRLLLIRGPEEVAAARQVLSEFFELTDVGWVNGRCEEEIHAYHKNIQAAAAGGRAKAWRAVDKVIRSHIRVGQADEARALLAEFVGRHEHDEATRAVEEMIANLEQSASDQGQLDLVAQAALASALQSAHGRARAGTVREVCAQAASNVREGCAQDASTLRAPANQNQNQNQNQNHKPTPQPPTLIEGTGASAVELSAAFRKAGVGLSHSDPSLVALARQGVSVEDVVAACEEAARSKKGKPITVAYVVGVLERWKREATETSLQGVRAPVVAGLPGRFNPVAHVNRNRLGGGS
jgi:uncharacterized protein YdaU (DUF1376 family)